MSAVVCNRRSDCSDQEQIGQNALPTTLKLQPLGTWITELEVPTLPLPLLRKRTGRAAQPLPSDIRPTLAVRTLIEAVPSCLHSSPLPTKPYLLLQKLELTPRPSECDAPVFGVPIFVSERGWLAQLRDTAGISSQVRPSSSRPVCFLKTPPHCLKKNGTAASTQSSRISRTQPVFIGRAPGPDSPPTITQSIPDKSNLGKGPSKGSSDKNFVRAPHSLRCVSRRIFGKIQRSCATADYCDSGSRSSGRISCTLRPWAISAYSAGCWPRNSAFRWWPHGTRMCTSTPRGGSRRSRSSSRPELVAP